MEDHGCLAGGYPDAGGKRAKRRVGAPIGCDGSSEYWDSLARPFASYERVSGYAREFIARMGLLPGESVLDVGCGSGTLAVPLSDMGHRVVGVDFSPKMLASVQDVVDEEGIGNIELVEASWEDDWDSMDIPTCDVAVASRSLWSDIPAGIAKLDSHASRRACLTIAASPEMFRQTGLEAALGRVPATRSDGLAEVLDALLGLGRQPEVSYIRSRRIDVYASKEIVCRHIEARVGGISDSERAAFEDYCSAHVAEHAGEDGQPDGWCCDEGNESAWAFVAWDMDPYGGDCRVEVHRHVD